MTLAEIVAICPPVPDNEVTSRELGDGVSAHHWFQPEGGRGGWLWVVTIGDEVIAFGCSGSDALERDIETGRAIAASYRTRAAARQAVPS